MTVSYEATAEVQIEEAFDHYNQARIGLGHRFMNELDDVVDLICRIPFGKLWQGQIRYRRMNRFPYYIFYMVDTVRQQIVILALIHTARNPSRWPGAA